MSVPDAISAQAEVDQPLPPYNPYPPGILPSDLDAEIARVQREVQFIFNEALNEWRALPRPILAGNPPTLRGSGYEAVEILGKLLNFDPNMSPFGNEACGFCHMPCAAFSGPIRSVNLTMVAYPATFRYRAGKCTAQRYTYSPDFPVLEYNTTQGGFFGGNFWDARSTGYKLQNPDAEQAQHPPVDMQEMGFPDTACIAFRLSKAVYRPLFELVWGADFDIRWPGDTEKICATPGGAARFGGSHANSAEPERPHQGKQYLRPLGTHRSFTTTYPDINTYTGQCMTGGTAATHGNEFPIPAPQPLPPCASAICGVQPLPAPNPLLGKMLSILSPIRRQRASRTRWTLR